MTVSEKANYIKGLMDGMSLDTNTNEGKLFAAMADLLEDLSLAVADLEEEVAAMRDYIDELDTDLAEVETELYGDDECDCDCCDCDDDWDGEFYEITCPACGATFEVDEDTLLDGGIACPECDEPLEFDIECDCEDDDCDCGCCDDE